MKCEILKRTAIALFVSGIISASATAEDKSVEAAGSDFGKAIKVEITKQTEAVKSEVTEKITKQDEKIKEISDDLSGVASDLVGVAANSYNNTLTLNGFKAGDDVYDVNPETGKVTKKQATAEDVNNDPLGGKGIVATVVKNKDSIEDLSEDLAETDDKVEELAGHVKKNREDLIEAAGAVKDLQDGVSDLHKVVYGPEGKPEEGLANVVDKHSEIINDLKRYNHLDDVKALVENKADKTELAAKADNQALEDLKKEVKDNEEGIGELSETVSKIDDNVVGLTDAHNELLKEHNNLVEDVKAFNADYNKFTDAVHDELDEKANASDVYTKAESNSKLDAKANVSDVYTKAESNSKLDAKANVSDVYTKAESNSKLNAKANASEVYTKTESDSKLNAKANVADVYSKTETDNKFALKADNSVVSAHTKRLDHLDNRVNKLDKDLKRGLATQAALTGLFQPYTVGKANVTAAVGGYKSQTAVAIGTGYRYNKHVATKAGIAFTQGGAAYNVGVNFEW